jgi:hypothetical protein
MNDPTKLEKETNAVLKESYAKYLSEVREEYAPFCVFVGELVKRPQGALYVNMLPVSKRCRLLIFPSTSSPINCAERSAQ